MDEKDIITKYFESDDPPATVTAIESLYELGEHCYKVEGKDEDGEFEISICVIDSSIYILPE